MGILPTADPRVEPVITGPLITGPLITGPPESPELPELTEIMDGALVIFLCSEAGEAGMVQLWGEGEKRERELVREDNFSIAQELFFITELSVNKCFPSTT